MPALHKLSTVKNKTASPGKYSDGGGLWLHKREDGGAMGAAGDGSRQASGNGAWQAGNVSVKETYAQASKWHAVARDDTDPTKERERERREAANSLNTLANFATDAFESRKAELKDDGKAGRWFTLLQLHVLPKLGKIPVGKSTSRTSRTFLRQFGTPRPIQPTKHLLG